MPILQWRDAKLDLATVQEPDHGKLLEGPHIRTCGMEEFVSEILAQARQKPAPAYTPEGVGPWIFVNSDRCDRELAVQLRDWFKNQRLSAATPLAAAKPQEARKYLEDNLRGCDGVLLIYGGCDSSWISGQLVQIAQQDRKRSQKLRALALCKLPPAEKQELDFIPANLITLDGRQGLTPAFWTQVEAFSGRLRG